MTPEQIQLIQSSWAQIAPQSDQAAQLFYRRLFEIAPEVKPLFKGDMTEQGAKLMKMLNTAVYGLERIDEILPAIQAMGRRHLDYGVKDEHYDRVGEALLWTLAQGLGDGFTDEVKAAWTDAYALLAEAMKTAAAGRVA